MRPLQQAIEAAREGEYLRALTMFLDVFGSEEGPRVNASKTAIALSYFGLSLALVQKKFKPAIELCRRAIALEFYNGEHYANLARVYIAAGNRKKALETLEDGFKAAPDDEILTLVREAIGVRARPAVPFLDRSHPINVSIGQSRHAKKVDDTGRKKT